MRILLSLFASIIFFACSQQAPQQGATGSPLPTATPSTSTTPKIESRSSVSFIKGTVSVKRGPETISVSIGDKIFENDTITTLEDSNCELDLEGIGTISISQNTSFLIKTLLTDGKKVLAQTEVLRGNVRAKVHKLAKGEQFLVGSKSAVAGVRGTEFAVSVGEGDITTVAVNEGSVAILPPSTDLALLESAEIFDQIADSAPHITQGKESTILVGDLKTLQDQLDVIQRLIDQAKAEQDQLKKAIDTYEKDLQKSKIDSKPLSADTKKLFLTPLSNPNSKTTTNNGPQIFGQETADPVYLSDLKESSEKTGWFGLLKNSIGPTEPLILNNSTLKKGLLTHAPAEVVYNLDGSFKGFKSQIGLFDSGAKVGRKVVWKGNQEFRDSDGSVQFQVWVDNRLAYQSEVMRWNDHESIDISVADAQTLKLVVLSVDTDASDWAVWGDAMLTKKSPIK